MEIVRKLSKMGQFLFEWPLIRLDISVSFRLCGSVCVGVCVYVCGCVCVGEREGLCVCVWWEAHMCMGFSFCELVCVCLLETERLQSSLKCYFDVWELWANTELERLKFSSKIPEWSFLNTFWWNFYVWSL